MITVHEALEIIKLHSPMHDLGTKETRADRDYPPFNRVMMDGIAIRFDDYDKGMRSFPIEGISAAGEKAKTLRSGSLEVMTGSVLPLNSDLVIQYEHLKIENNIATIVVEVPRFRFDSVHLEGSDCKKGDVVLLKNLPMTGPHVGILSSMGESLIPYSPKVMIISTGDELVENNPLPHEIRRSNVFALKSSLELFGFQDVKETHLDDDPKMIAKHFQQYAGEFDILIYSGGVSKGKFDYLPSVWADMGVTKYFHEVSQRPGKPLWFGVDEKRKTTVIGLPGNPVSSLVCLHRYFLPNRKIQVKLTKEITFKKPLTYFVPVKIEFVGAELFATPLEMKNSGEFTALAGSDGFIELPKELDQFHVGETYSFFSWRPF
jgi:molybdopterin molybdotransferase